MTELEETFHIYSSRYFRFGKKKLDMLLGIGWADLDKHVPPIMGKLAYYCQEGSSKPTGYKILINKKYKNMRKIWRGTLLHEMVHLKLEGKLQPWHDAHGRLFQKEMKRLVRIGAFNGLW